MKIKFDIISALCLLAAVAGLGTLATAAHAQPQEIRNPDMLDTHVLDYNGPVLLVICKDTAQCAQIQKALEAAESDPDFVKGASQASKQNAPALRFSWSLASNLPELSQEWDAGDRAVCLKDASKKESECNALAYPVYIIKNAPNARAPGVEELQRGGTDLKGIVGMALHAFDNLGVDQNKN